MIVDIFRQQTEHVRNLPYLHPCQMLEKTQLPPFDVELLTLSLRLRPATLHKKLISTAYCPLPRVTSLYIFWNPK